MYSSYKTNLSEILILREGNQFFSEIYLNYLSIQKERMINKIVIYSVLEW